MVTGDKPDEQVDWAEVARSVDEAVIAETLPRVCSTEECAGPPVVRFAGSPDCAHLLCAECAVYVGVAFGMEQLRAQMERHGILLLDRDVQELTRRATFRLALDLEVL